ncbi:MAG: hypothetical protein KKF44_09670 [Nanoarchaeota archaeon]|nr:hypothetical protein [Nanoarchaeota archaeon]
MGFRIEDIFGWPRLDNIAERLNQANRFEPDTLQTASEITDDRFDNSIYIQFAKIISSKYRQNRKELGEWSFNTGDTAIYTTEDGKAILYFSSRYLNPILNDLKTSYDQLVQNGCYRVTDKAKEAVIDSDSTVRIELDDLLLEDTNPGSMATSGGERWDIDPPNDRNFTSTINISDDFFYDDRTTQNQRNLFERIFCYEKDVDTVRHKFMEKGINNIRIFLPNPDYITELTKDGSAIARYCTIYNLEDRGEIRSGVADSEFMFSATENHKYYGIMRGVLEEQPV